MGFGNSSTVQCSGYLKEEIVFIRAYIHTTYLNDLNWSDCRSITALLKDSLVLSK